MEPHVTELEWSENDGGGSLGGMCRPWFLWSASSGIRQCSFAKFLGAKKERTYRSDKSVEKLTKSPKVYSFTIQFASVLLNVGSFQSSAASWDTANYEFRVLQSLGKSVYFTFVSMNNCKKAASLSVDWMLNTSYDDLSDYWSTKYT